MRIAGDVQFAAEVNWLVDHVRWDVEDDLARADRRRARPTPSATGRAVVEALRKFAARLPTPARAGASAGRARQAGA